MLSNDGETIVCTCCINPREIVVRKDTDPMHVDDSTEAMTYHVHKYNEATDCDGRYTGETVYTATRFLAAHDPISCASRYDVWRRCLEFAVSAAADYATLTIKTNDDNIHTAEWNEQTDEGHRSAEYIECFDEECADVTSQRDHAAEAAGY